MMATHVTGAVSREGYAHLCCTPDITVTVIHECMPSSQSICSSDSHQVHLGSDVSVLVSEM